LAAAFPDDAEITFQTAVAHDNLGFSREAIPFYLRALTQGLSEPDLERALMGLGSTCRGLGEYQQAEEALRRGAREFPHNRAIQVFLAMTLYNFAGLQGGDGTRFDQFDGDNLRRKASVLQTRYFLLCATS